MILIDKATGIEYKLLSGQLVQIKKLEPAYITDDLIDCGLDFEFRDLDDDAWVIGKLTSISKRCAEGKEIPLAYWKSQDNSGCWYEQCRPRMNHWMSLVDCRTDIQTKLIDAGFNAYRNGDSIFIEGLQESRCYPWEAQEQEWGLE